MLLNILRFTPPWVWGLLAALLLLGWQQSRPRSVARAQLMVLPLALLALGLWSVLPAVRALPLILLVWLFTGALSFALGQRVFSTRGAAWQPQLSRLQLPGSWLPMLMILCIFMLKYGLGVFQAMQPGVASQPGFQFSAATLSGALSGLLLGRNWALLALTFAKAEPTTIFGHDPAIHR